MDAVQRTLFVIVAQPSKPKTKGEQNRRTRMSKAVDPQLRGWLMRVMRVHAHLCTVVRIYGNPEKAGGASNHGNDYVKRAASGDRTILHDALIRSGHTIYEIADEIEEAADLLTPTDALPGSAEKVEVLADRAAEGMPLFRRHDKRMDLT